MRKFKFNWNEAQPDDNHGGGGGEVAQFIQAELDFWNGQIEVVTEYWLDAWNWIKIDEDWLTLNGTCLSLPHIVKRYRFGYTVVTSLISPYWSTFKGIFAQRMSVNLKTNAPASRVLGDLNQELNALQHKSVLFQ